ncbi:MAG: ATP-binding protein [Methanobacteriota archaeon]
MPANPALRAKGRVVGTSVLEIKFRWPYGEAVYLGDLLAAEDPETGTRFLLRVTNVLHGVEAAAPDWAERAAGTMLRMDEAGRDHELHDKEARLYKLGIAAPLGYVRDGSFRKAKTLPAHFSPVERADARDFAFLAESMGDVELGFLRSGEEVVPFPAGIPGDRAFPHHVGIFATTGMGKSNLMKVLAASCISAGKYGLLILDPHGEYYDGGGGGRKGLKHHPKSENLVVYAARELSGLHNKLTVSSHEIEIADLRNLFEFSDPQMDLLSAARYQYKTGWFSALNDRPEEQIAHELPGKFYEGTIAVVKRKIRRLFATGLVHRDAAVTVTKSILGDLRRGKTVLVDTGGLSEAEELLVATVLARAIFEGYKSLFGTGDFDRSPPVLITVEEAQRVLGHGSKAATNVFAQIAREGRKFKVGLCAITQQPKLLDSEVISQFNTLLVLGLADKRDRDILQDSAKQDVTSLQNEIQMLMPGEALLASPYAPFAVPAKIHLYEEFVERLGAPAAASLSPVAAPVARADPAFY